MLFREPETEIPSEPAIAFRQWTGSEAIAWDEEGGSWNADLYLSEGGFATARWLRADIEDLKLEAPCTWVHEGRIQKPEPEVKTKAVAKPKAAKAAPKAKSKRAAAKAEPAEPATPKRKAAKKAKPEPEAETEMHVDDAGDAKDEEEEEEEEQADADKPENM